MGFSGRLQTLRGSTGTAAETTGTDGSILNIQAMFDGPRYIVVFGPATLADVDQLMRLAATDR